MVKVPAVVIVSFPLMVILRLALAMWPAESVTWTVKLKIPETVGAPESTPPGLRLNPVGRAPVVTAHVNGPVPLDAVNVV